MISKKMASVIVAITLLFTVSIGIACASRERNKNSVVTENATTETATTTTTTVTTTVKATTTTKKETTSNTTTTKKETTAEVFSVDENGDKTSLGSFKITVYVPSERWGYATATGVKSKHLQTCAVDPNVVPLGSYIEINGVTLLCCDTGSVVKGNVIDIFYDGTDSEAISWICDFGDRHEVYLVG